MKVLYGVQGTGNGHLSRARAMAAAFESSDLDVDFLFSGRPADRFFDMECFGDYRVRQGMTFANIEGRVDYLRTVLENNYWHFFRDVFSLDLSAYDYVITDFEPITAWAGRLRGKTVISMGHQPAFDHPVPVANRDLRTSLVLKLFAPGNVRVGMHWHKYDAPILPPLLHATPGPVIKKDRKVIVYLPFEIQERVHDVMSRLPEFDFYIYAPGSEHRSVGNLQLRPTSLKGFQADLHDCAAVVCNAGFELSSECLALGKRLLVKPQERQMEQASNALALRQLGYGAAIEKLDAATIRAWLEHELPAPHIHFPDVAGAITRWLEVGDFRESTLHALSDSLWRKVNVNANTVGTC
ncbi:MAG: glycosyltransferase [Congregibacter sp.]|nr:glycosyltransferase [Congregibacter sp.]MDP5070901.1 glycosyltransferase [Congregibacter sp.]